MSIPFKIPASLAARVNARDLVRNGAILRDIKTGRIVAHLQETSHLTQLATSAGNPLSMLRDGIQVYQNEQIKAGLLLMQNLQMANLALSGVGIGVSVASFAIITRKLDGIEQKIGEIAVAIQHLSKKVEGLEQRLCRVELAQLRAELRRINEAWGRSDGLAQWALAADRLITIEQTFHDHARALSIGNDEGALREQMVDAFALAGSARISALLVINVEDEPGKAAHDFARALKGLTGAIGTPQLLREMLAREQGPLAPAARMKAIERLRLEAERRTAALREREDAAATTPLTIAALRSAGVSGREWLERARCETDAPLICLLVDEADSGVELT